MKKFECWHTDSLLRKHQLLVRQVGDGNSAKFTLVDWRTLKPASAERIAAFQKEDVSIQ